MALRDLGYALLFSLTCVFPTWALGAVPDRSAPEDIAQWGLHCFCITARHTPHGVIRTDSSGRILWLARTGVTKSDLRAEQIPVTDSQILLLRTYGLLEQDGDRLTTTFPVLGPDVMSALRERLRGLAVDLAPQLTPDVAAISSRLARADHARYAYAVVFGYALDGLLWDELRKRNALPDTALDLDHPLWKGAFWAIFPERSGTPGTNEDSLGDRTLVSVWTDHTVAPLKGLVQSITDTKADGQGGVRAGLDLDLPVIDNTEGDFVHDRAKAIAVATAATLMDSRMGGEILSSIPQASRQQAVLIVAHEFIWDLIERLVELGAIQAPAALNASAPTRMQLQELLFVRAQQKP